MIERQPEIMQSDGRASRRLMRWLSGKVRERAGAPEIFLADQAIKSFATQALIAIMKRECAAGLDHKAGSEPDSCAGCTQTRANLRVIRGLAGIRPGGIAR